MTDSFASDTLAQWISDANHFLYRVLALPTDPTRLESLLNLLKHYRLPLETKGPLEGAIGAVSGGAR
jgi:hypothetical protein